jgi:hypothetical protein
MRYALGVTRRRHDKALADGPLEHASTGRRRTPHGVTLRALCGAGVHERIAAEFDPDSPRACPRCAVELEARR